MSFLTHHATIVSAGPVGDNLVIIRRLRSNISLGNGQALPDTLVREVYGVRDGKITLIKKSNGRVIPPSSETFQFDEEEDI